MAEIADAPITVEEWHSMQVAVIGAGPAGLTAALKLSQRGAGVNVYEAADRVGGLARSFDLWGQRLDLGPHRFFSTDARVNRLWLEVVGREYRMVDRLTRIYYQGRYFHYPLQMADVLVKLGPINAALCLASYAKEKLLPRHPHDEQNSFESWVVHRFGRRLFETFFKSYSEKLWGMPCGELDADFAAQRIKKFSLGEAVKRMLSLRRNNVHTTLVDRFAYPLHGTGSVYEKMAERVTANAGEIHLRAPVRRITHEGFQVTGVELMDGNRVACNHVISTMPLTLLVRGLGDVPHDVQTAVDALSFRNTVLVYLHVDAVELFPDQWVYMHAPEFGMGRVTNFRNWVPELYGEQRTTVLAVEYWCWDADPLWAEADDKIVERATHELRATGLLGKAPVLAGHVVRVPRSYPVYRRGYREHVACIVDYLQRFRGLTPIGRYGAFKYNSQDHSILMGILAAENILDNRSHDLWSVNADYESYQEDALISETGLVQDAIHA
jgi:protoporphyrinogen oxidase